MTFGEIARTLEANGYRPVPIKNGTKRPPMNKWSRFELDDASLRTYGQCGTGLLTGHLVGIDIDVLHEEAAAKLRVLAFGCLGFWPIRIGQSPKELIVYRTEKPFRKIQTRVFAIDGQPCKVEVLGEGQQFVAYATHPDTKEPYEWPDERCHPLITPLDDLPEVTKDQLNDFLTKAEGVLARYGTPVDTSADTAEAREHPEPPPNTGPSAYAEAALADEAKAVATAPVYTRDDTLNRAAFALGQLVGSGFLDRGRVQRTLEDAASANGLTHDDGLDTVRRTILSGIGAGLKEPRDVPEQQPKAKRPKTGIKAEADTTDLIDFALTEDGIALAFAHKYRDVLRYCHHTGGWYLWTGNHWRREQTKLAYAWCCEVCRQLAQHTKDESIRRTLARAATAAAVERHAQADRAFAVTSEI